MSKPNVKGRAPPPPISADSAIATDIYEVLEPQKLQPQPQQPPKRNSQYQPPVPLADENEQGSPNDPKVNEFTEDEEYNDNRKNDNYYLQPDDRDGLDAYYADTDSSIISPSNSALNKRVLPGNYQQQMGSPYWLYQSDQNYDGLPEDADYYDEMNGRQEARVGRNQSQKKMGRAIITGLNTARVKEIRGRLKPTFTQDEVVVSMERKQSTKAEDEAMDNVDVSSMSVMERMQLLQARAKKAPPSTYPKPRAATAAAAAASAAAAGQADPSSKRTSSPRPMENRTSSPLPQRTASPSKSHDQDDLAWYFGAEEHLKCEQMLFNLNKDGGFLIRMTKKGEAKMHPYVLCVFHDGEIYNFLIRQKPNLKYAVGSEKPGEPEFAALSDLVNYHRSVPIKIVSSRKPSGGGQVTLVTSPVKVETAQFDCDF